LAITIELIKIAVQSESEMENGAYEK